MAQLIVETGPSQGTAIALLRENSCTIGSDPSCDLHLSSAGIASHHLVVKALKGSGYGVKCLEGSCALNQRAIEVARLTSGDLLEIGGVKIRFVEPATKEADSKLLGGFRLIRVLGQGGMGTVHEAEQVSLHREVALKVLSKDLTKDPVFVARFVAEARAAARLHHPNVVQVFDVGHDGDTYYYSMELMHEGSLERRLRASGKLPVEQALSVVADAARGLAYAESLRIVHRDIKPDNLMLDRHGHVKLADLGLALSDEDDVSKVVGTPHFMSPEQALGKPLDHRSDLYSLGCTLYRLLTGRVPYKRDSVKEILRAHVKDPPEPVHKVNPEVPAEVAAIVHKLLEKDPQARYASATDLLAELEAVLAPPSRKGLVITAIGAAVVIASGALAWGLTRPEGKTETKIIKESDPRVAKALEDVRQKDAEIARLQALLAGELGLALAERLEQVAVAHPETSAAAQAQQQARTLRAEHAAIEEQRAAEAQRRQEGLAALRSQVEPLIAASNYRGASQQLADAGPESLRADPEFVQAVAALRQSLQDHARTRLGQLRAALESAQQAGDPAAIELALAELERVTDAKTGWPDDALPAAGETIAVIESGRAALVDLEAQRAADAAAALWTTYRKGLLGANGVLAAVDRLDLDQAIALTRGLHSELGNSLPGIHAGALIEGLTRANTFLTRFAEAAAAGRLTYTAITGTEENLDALPVTAFAAGGEQPGLTIKVGPTLRPKAQVVALAELRGPRLAEVFRLPEQSKDDLDRAAFLGWIGLADHLAAARGFLARVDPQRPRSGTGAEGYGGDVEVLIEASQALDSIAEPWAQALTQELDAAQSLARGLRALSVHHNLAAAAHLDRLLQSHARSLVVLALEP